VIEKTLPLLKATTNSEDLLFYPFMLRYLKQGWTLEARRVCFTALNLAEKLNGASTYFKAISDTRSELAAALSPTDAQTLASVIFPPKPTPLLPTAMPGHSFKNWKLADLAPKLDQVSRGRSFEKAKAALVSTQCVFCHKVSLDPTLPAGIFGPDLTQVSARFNRHDLLMHILEPSKFIDEKFKLVNVTKKDGSTMTGSLDSEDDERITLRINPLAADTTEIGKSMIRSRQISDISPMPPGLLNNLKAEQILDLLAWFEASGDPKHKAFQP
jgi:putative heme-binding domain-containing protein